MLPDCPVCGGAPGPSLVERRGFPTFLNSVRKSRDEARALPRGDVAFVACARCGLVWNRAFEPEEHVFDASYNPDQIGSPAFDDHVSRIADRVAAACANLAQVDLLEIGCGQGDFLQEMVDRLGSRVRHARGFDPAFWDGQPRFRDPRIHVERRYFDKEAIAALDVSANVVITRHAVQHVAEPRSFFRDVRAVLRGSGAKVFVETINVSWIFERRATYDLFYEHCCIYAAPTLAKVLRDAGLAVSAIDPSFAGQYLFVDAGNETTADTYVPTALASLESLMASDRTFIARWTERLRRAGERGPVLLWGAGAKGASFCVMVDPAGDLVAAVVDINATKQGGFIPGTGHPIVAPSDRAVAAAKTVVVSNGNYKSEIAASLASRGLTPILWTLDEPLSD